MLRKSSGRTIQTHGRILFTPALIPTTVRIVMGVGRSCSSARRQSKPVYYVDQRCESLKKRDLVIMTGPLLFVQNGLFKVVAKFTFSFMKGDDGMIKNKIYSIIMLTTGGVFTALTKDATVLVLLSMFAIPMFFSKKEWIY